ncbi:Acyl carrier protein [Streptomyces sp. enrichment culture]
MRIIFAGFLSAGSHCRGSMLTRAGGNDRYRFRTAVARRIPHRTRPQRRETTTMSDLTSSLSSELRTRVREIVADVLEVPADELVEDKSLEDLGADSLMAIEIFSRFERQLGIRIPQEEMTELEDLRAAYDLVARHQPSAEAAGV